MLTHVPLDRFSHDSTSTPCLPHSFITSVNVPSITTLTSPIQLYHCLNHPPVAQPNVSSSFADLPPNSLDLSTPLC